MITVLSASIPLIERDLQLERERLEVDQVKAVLQAGAMEHKQKRGIDITAAVAEFLQWDAAHRKAMRAVFMLQMEDAFPNKRARALFCTKLMKFPLPAAAAPVPVVVVEAAPLPAPAPAAVVEVAPAPAPAAALPGPTSGVYVLQLSNGNQ